MKANSFLARDYKTFVGKVIVLPSYELVYNQGIRSLKWKSEGTQANGP